MLLASIDSSKMPEFMDDKFETRMIEENDCVQDSILRAAAKIFGSEDEDEEGFYMDEPN